MGGLQQTWHAVHGQHRLAKFGRISALHERRRQRESRLVLRWTIQAPGLRKDHRGYGCGREDLEGQDKKRQPCETNQDEQHHYFRYLGSLGGHRRVSKPTSKLSS